MLAFSWISHWAYLVLPVICLFGLITNLINIAIILHPKISNISFKYFLAISISDLLYLGLISYSFIVQCTDCPLHSSYFTQFYDFIIFHYICSSLAIFGILVDITLSLIRYSILIKKKYLQSFSYHRILAFLLLISFVYYMPLLFFKQITPIQKLNNNTSTIGSEGYILVRNTLGLSLFGTIIPIVLSSLRIFLVLVVLTTVNTLISIEYKKKHSVLNNTNGSNYLI